VFGGGGVLRRVQRSLCGKTGWRTACLGALLAMGCNGGKTGGLVVEPVEVTLPADGHEHRAFTVRGTGSSVLLATVNDGSVKDLRLVPTGKEGFDGWLTSPVTPLEQTFRLKGGGSTAVVTVRFTLDPTDSYGDGTPDFLRLHDGGDRQAFRAWFASIAEAVADLPPERVPAEINDCSALLRYAYREALRNHDDRWIHDAQWTEGASEPSIRQYRYPQTPLGAALFRITPGSFQPGDLNAGSFAQFADARTLMQRNTHFVSRDIRTARRGDLFFYRQLEQNSPYHSMIVTGDNADWVVYDTGPIGKEKGEVRRVSTEDLLHHPDLRWRPVPGNSNFLGVYRWNILREGE
jgi:uncharacterized protein YfaT (DUF1175 family)